MAQGRFEAVKQAIFAPVDLEGSDVAFPRQSRRFFWQGALRKNLGKRGPWKDNGGLFAGLGVDTLLSCRKLGQGKRLARGNRRRFIHKSLGRVFLF